MAYAVFNDGATDGREPWVDYEFTDEPFVEVLGEKAPGQTERVELIACLGRHLIGAVHGAHGRVQRAARGVAEALPRPDQGLLAHDPRTAHVLLLALGVGDDPVAREQPDRPLGERPPAGISGVRVSRSDECIM